MHLNSIVLRADITRGHSCHDHAAFDLGQKRFLGPLPQESQLELAHRSFEAQQQSIVEQPWIVDAIVVNDQRLRHSAEIDPLVPIAIIAGQARSLQGEHGPDLALEN